MVEDKEITTSTLQDPVGASDKPHEGDTPKSNAVRRGRPSKAEIAAKKPGGRAVRGRPPGEKAIMDEYKARMLRSKKSRKVLDKVLEVALEDGHPHQGVCIKLVTERILPAKSFEEAKQGGHKVEININMESPAEVSVGDNDTAIDAEYEEVSIGGLDE